MMTQYVQGDSAMQHYPKVFCLAHWYTCRIECRTHERLHGLSMFSQSTNDLQAARVLVQYH